MDMGTGDEVSIVHVDDDREVTSLTAEMLEQRNGAFDVRTATAGDEALRMIEERVPDCLITDYRMPDLNGLQLISMVRSEYPRLPIILFTIQDRTEIASRAFEVGATEYLRKGSDIAQYDVLANRISNVVTGTKVSDRYSVEK